VIDIAARPASHRQRTAELVQQRWAGRCRRKAWASATEIAKALGIARGSVYRIIDGEGGIEAVGRADEHGLPAPGAQGD